MEKVKVSKGVAEAIGTLRSEGGSNECIVTDHLSEGTWKRLTALNGLDVDTLIRALYIGYEVEQTPEEKVREYYQSQWNEATGHARGVCLGIKETLDLLNIKISGVNDK